MGRVRFGFLNGPKTNRERVLNGTPLDTGSVAEPCGDGFLFSRLVLHRQRLQQPFDGRDPAANLFELALGGC